jgi:hypothetical protein
MCKWIVQVSERLPSLLEWTMILTCMSFSEFLCLPSRLEAISFRLSQFIPTNYQSVRLPRNDDRTTRPDLMASKTFILYVQAWMLFHVTSAPFKIQAKIWPMIFWGAVKTATTSLLTAAAFSYLTLRLSNEGVLTGHALWIYCQVHFVHNYMFERLFLDIWKPRALLLSNGNLMLPSQQLRSYQELDVYFGCIGLFYFFWCLCIGLARSSSHYSLQGVFLCIDIYMNICSWSTINRYTGWRGAPGSTVGYEYVVKECTAKDGSS